MLNRIWKLLAGAAAAMGGLIYWGFEGFPGHVTLEAMKSHIPFFQPADERPPNSQHDKSDYKVFTHQCEYANYEIPEFKKLKEARDAIERALLDSGFASVED